MWSLGKALTQWAELDKNDCAARLPELIRRLIHSTTPGLHRYHFPAGEGVWLSGFDGVVENAETTPFVPAGYSIWELGVGKDPEKKAEEDYKKRAKDPASSLDRREVTFVFVTPRPWPGKEEWVLERRKEKAWREVRAYDAHDLEQWLSCSEPASAWLCEHLDLPFRAQSLEWWWEAWSLQTSPPISEVLPRLGREREQEALLRWLSGPLEAQAVRVADAEEGVAFLYACLLTLPPEERRRQQDRAVLVQGDDELRRVGRTNRGALVVAPGGSLGEARATARRGHHVLVTGFELPARESLTLESLDRRRMAVELTRMGLPEAEADRLAHASRGDLVALRRLLGDGRAPPIPAEIVPLLLLGAWREDHEADREAIRRLLDQERDAACDLLLRRHSVGLSPLLVMENGVGRWSSRLDAWRRGVEALRPRDLEHFRALATEVLREIHPRFDLPPAERWLAAVRGKVSRWSEALRQGVLEGLVWLATEELPSELNGAGWAELIVQEVLAEGSPWERWATLGHDLTILAEAAPEVFLRCAARLIEREPDTVCALLRPEEGAPLDRVDHGAGLIAALEVLAWHPDHLAQATRLLMSLVVLAPGSTWIPDVLRGIFLYWRPHTTASVDVQIAALDGLDLTHRELAFDLLLRLLPKHHDTAMGGNQPRHRGWLRGWQDAPSPEDATRMRQAIWDRVVEGVRECPDRLIRVLPHLHQLSVDMHLPRILEIVEGLPGEVLSEPQRRELWAALRSVLTRHMRYPESEVALDREQLKPLQRLYERLAPPGLWERCRWLFDEGAVLPDLEPGGWEERRQRLEAARQEAMLRILPEHTPEALLRLAARCASPHLFASTLGQVAELETLRAVVNLPPVPAPEELSRLRPAIAYGLRVREGGLEIAEVITLAWEPLARAELALGLLARPDVWTLVEALGEDARRLYWSQVQAPPWNTDLRHVVEELVRVGRFHDAAGLLTMAFGDAERKTKRAGTGDVWSLVPVLPEELTRFLDMCMERGELPEPHELKVLFDALSQAGPAWEETLSRLEWSYLPALEFTGYRPVHVFRRLSEDPAFFLDVLSLRYPPAEAPARPPSELECRAAENAYRLLRLWDLLPGTHDEGSVDPVRLLRWIDEARALARQRGLQAVADIHIGQILARAPTDGDGQWPPEAVCQVLERLRDTSDIEQGIVSGVINSTGASWRSPYGGGSPERRRASQYRDQAEALRARWPVAARILRALAEYQDRSAEFWDSRFGKLLEDHPSPPGAEDRLRVWIDHLEIAGRYTFTTEQAHAEIQDELESLERALRRLREDRRVVSPESGFHVVVPLRWSKVGAPPPDWYIQEWMDWAGLPYRVGLRSAAALYGAAPQAPQDFQVLVPAERPRVKIGGSWIAFIAAEIRGEPRRVNTETGTMNVSTPEQTALELVEHAPLMGGIDAAASVLVELGEELDPVLLAMVAQGWPSPTVQRLGWVLEQLGHRTCAEALAAVVEEKANGVVWLRSEAPVSQAPTEPGWRLVVEYPLELDT